MKLCKDCRWAVNTMPNYKPQAAYPALADYTWRCQHPSATKPTAPPSPVTGAVMPSEQMSCPEARGADTDRCGPAGRFWEPSDDFEPPVTEIIGFGEPPLEYVPARELVGEAVISEDREKFDG
jgi:hypothetical protein